MARIPDTISTGNFPVNGNGDRTIESIHQQVAEDAPVILWMTGPDGRHHYFNRLWQEFTGLDNTDDPDGSIWLEAVHSDDREQLIQPINQ